MGADHVIVLLILENTMPISIVIPVKTSYKFFFSFLIAFIYFIAASIAALVYLTSICVSMSMAVKIRRLRGSCTMEGLMIANLLLLDASSLGAS